MQGDVQAGSVVWNLDVEDSQYDAKMERASRTARSTASSVNSVLGSVTRSIGTGFARIASSVASVSFNTVLAGSTAAGAAITALGIRGITSANQLQSLQISLNGLTRNVNLGAQAMAGALAYAQKAPFQLPEVAGTTKTLIAFGLSATDAVKKLDLLGNIAITTGVPLATLGTIFGRVSAQGKLMNQDIQQLTENGVAVLPALQRELGKTATEVQELASAGEISVGQFEKALASIVDPSILAQLTNTLPRQLDRLNGSLRILSNSFVGVGVSATAGFTAASNGLDVVLTNIVRATADALRSGPILAAAASIGTSLASLLDGLAARIQPVVNGIAGLATSIANLGALALPILGLALAGFGALAGQIPILGAALAGITGPIGLTIGLLASLIALSPELRASIGTAITAFGEAFRAVAPSITSFADTLRASFQAVGAAMAPVLVSLAQSLGTLLGSLAPLVPLFLQLVVGALQNVLLPLMPAIVATINVLSAAFTSLMPVVGQVAQIIVQLAGTIIAGLAPLLPVIAAAFGQLVNALAPVIPILLQFAVDIIQRILVPVIPVVVKVVEILAQAMLTLLRAVAPLLPSLLTLAVIILEKVLLPVLSALSPLLPVLAQAFNLIVAAVQPLLPQLIGLVIILVQNLAPVLPQLVDLFIQLVLALVPVLPPLLQLVTILLPPLISLITVLANVFTALLASSLGLVIGIIKDLVIVTGNMARAFSAFWMFVLRIAGAIVQTITGLADGIGQRIGDVLRTIANFQSLILNAFGGAGSLLYESGRQIVRGLLDGVGSLLPSIGQFFLDKLPGFIREPFKRALGIRSPSTVFKGYGVNVVEGLANGVAGSVALVSQAMSGLSDQLQIESAMSIGATGGSPLVTPTSVATSTTAAPR